MYRNSEVERIDLGPQYSHSRTRVTQATFIVTIAAFLAGTVAITRDPRWALISAAVVFGWSKFGGP